MLATIFDEFPAYHTLSVDERKSLYAKTLAYAFKWCTFCEYTAFVRRALGSPPASEVRAWARSKVLENGYLMHNIKHWVYNTVALRTDAKRIASRYGIHERDERLWSLFQDGSEAFRRLSRIAKKPIPMRCTEDLFNEIIQSNLVFLNKFSRRKLRFVCMYSATDYSDIVQTLVCRGLRALRHEWPVYPSKQYMNNLFCRSCQNEGLNIIDQATSEKNARIVQDGAGFRITTMSLDYLTEGDLYLPVSDSRWQQTVDLAVDIERHINNRWQGALVECLSTYHVAFSAWLGNHGYVNDNEILRERTHLEDYVHLVAKWLNVPFVAAKGFVSSLREGLRDWRGFLLSPAT